MNELLFDHVIWFKIFEIFFLLLGVIAAVVIGYLILRRRWQTELEQTLAKARAQYDPRHHQILHDHLQSAVAHEFVKSLDSIRVTCKQMLEELGEGQAELRDKLFRVIEKVHDLIQHAHNVVGLFSLEPESAERELVEVGELMRREIRNLYPYARARGVHLRDDLPHLEPIRVNPYLIMQVFSNIVHNAIKYSSQGGVVNVKLGLEEDGEKVRVYVTVRDRGEGINEDDRERIFELKKRADGLVKPGSGLGLYFARKVARLHSGDVILMESREKQGSMFKIVLPYE